ncbi:hypothetical protein HUB94_11340 [Paenibacillus cellulosilyticus]|nr:hypothetical protein [Paenibacillus cellulosilyticus]QKS44938.1 hypothetical protein HUB94_11340 [Paenibacillus cellulosilyticus]
MKEHCQRSKNGVNAVRRRRDRPITPYSRIGPFGPWSGRGISGEREQADNPALAKSDDPGWRP